MQVRFVKDSIHSQLKQLLKIIPTKPQLPILSNVLISADETGCTFSSTDLYMGLRFTFPTQTKQAGIVAVPGKQCIESLLSMPAGEITMQLEDQQLVIRGGKNVVRLASVEASEYPDFPEVTGDTLEFTQEVIEKIQHRVLFSASTDQARPVLTAVYIDTQQHPPQAVSTDGFRLSILQLPNLSEKANSLLMPASGLLEVARIISTMESQTISLIVNEQQKVIVVKTDFIEYFVRMIEGDFPPYTKIIPQDFITTVTCDIEELLDHLKRAMIFSRDSSNIIQLKIAQTMQVVGTATTTGQYVGELDSASFEGQEQTAAFNARYLLDLLAQVKKGKLIIKLQEELKPTLWTVEGEEDFRYVVMPFRLTN